MARFAVISDLHGNYENLLAIQEKAAGRVDTVVLTGDYLEAKVSKKDLHRDLCWSLPDAVDPDAPLWEALSSCVLVRGNQEERITTVLRDRDVPDALEALLAAPPERATPTTRFVHGHRFNWFREGEDLSHPVLDALPDRPVLIHGHSHRRRLTTGLEATGQHTPLRLEPETGRVYQLPRSGVCLVNAGAAGDREAHWVLYDEEARTVTFETVRTTGVR
ncbi:metallophosphoesterase family protein [Streptomyces sp. ID05-04B]|uniref:metallophosphoesterase family protein n=1 Tax=unclassified Streptomyces TaxID=2593676 RepID=UPI00131EE497|nr:MULTISPECIES: metallophosphoesterase [unclassified Streptomyces]MDX5565516.1 metallophosphoesterase family protein [Streptomyces sp. ID05-04B]